MSDDIIRQTADIIGAFVAHNHLRAEELADLIAAVHGTLGSLDKPPEVAAAKPKPAVALPWKKTIKPDYLISLLDGRQYKTLRRHLSVKGLTPDEYRARFDLPRDYPMVAASYSERRSALAHASGLGNRAPDKTTAATSEIDEAAPVGEAASTDAPPTKPKRGRRRKAEAA